jgi:hypothetical protein
MVYGTKSAALEYFNATKDHVTDHKGMAMMQSSRDSAFYEDYCAVGDHCVYGSGCVHGESVTHSLISRNADPVTPEVGRAREEVANNQTTTWIEIW